MGVIMSPVEEIDKIHWAKVKKGQKLKALAVVVIHQEGQHDLMVADLGHGTFVSSRDLSGYAYMPGRWPWMDGTIKALVKLGAITPAAAARHMEACERNYQRNHARYNAEALIRLAEDTGIGLSPEQAAYVASNTQGATR